MSSLGPTHAAPWDLNQKCFHATKYLKLMEIAVSVFRPKTFWREKAFRRPLDYEDKLAVTPFRQKTLIDPSLN